MADSKTTKATRAKAVADQIKAGTLPTWHPKGDPTGTAWAEVAKEINYDAAHTGYREHGRQDNDSGRRV